MDEIEKRKPVSLRQAFEARKEIWRERKRIVRMQTLMKERQHAAKQQKQTQWKMQRDGTSTRRKQGQLEAEAQGTSTHDR